jgi:hypothetical protein
MKSFTRIIFILLIPLSSFCQVRDIKSASRVFSSGGDGSFSSGGSGIFADLFINIMFNGIIGAQQEKLERRHEVPHMVSLDLMLQTAAQPSSYYIVHPRVRANWGLFSTDFRMNYLIEEDVDGFLHIRTNDWQILQLNLITTREVVFRIGGGVMQEAFEARNGFAEWTAGLNYLPHATRLGCMAEYRGAEVRKEFNVLAQYKLFDKGAVHGFTTAGFVYQRYYSAITTWGLQGGFILRVY